MSTPPGQRSVKIPNDERLGWSSDRPRDSNRPPRPADISVRGRVLSPSDRLRYSPGSLLLIVSPSIAERDRFAERLIEDRASYFSLAKVRTLITGRVPDDVLDDKAAELLLAAVTKRLQSGETVVVALEGLGAEEEADGERRAALAGPRATARVLTGLPLLGVGLGMARLRREPALALIALILLTSMVLAAVFFIVETLPPARRRDLGHSTMRQRYRSLLGDRVFIGVAIIGGMTFSGLFTYLSSSSFLFQDVYGLDPQQFGLLFAVNSLGIVSGVQVSAFLMRVIGPQWILVGAGVALLVTSATIVVLDMQAVGLFGILVPLFFFIMACGFSFPATQVLALNGHGSEAGTAASLLGALNFGLAGIISPIVGLFGIANAIPMGAIMGLTAMVSIVVMWTVVRPRSVPALSR